MEKKKKEPKEWSNYHLDFTDGSIYWGTTSDPIKREKQHQKSWLDPFIMVVVPGIYTKKSDALIRETYEITRHYLFGDKSKLKNRYLGRLSLPLPRQKK